MVRKALLVLFTFGLISGQLWAGPITAERAAQKAKRFMTEKKGGGILTPTPFHGTAVVSHDNTNTTAPLLHVFNIGQDEGFIIMSGEDSTPEVLGYAEKGSYDYDQLPDNARAWIDNYARQIEALRQSGAQAASASAEVHDAIPTLLTCEWNQDAPYYNSCPKVANSSQTVTGCVATAMAQVLYCHREKSVTTLQATIPAYQCYTNWSDANGNSLGHISVNSFPAGSLIDWSNMLDRYDNSATEAQKKAVADLMAFCGASVEMEYKPSANGGSGAFSIAIPEALKKYFGCSETATLKYRDNFTADNWDRLIYRELMNGRPVIFGGQDAAKKAGHAFVCDGYDGKGMFHFNWGWGGLANGYYLITNLAPTYQGTGGNGSAYNDDVDAIIGVEPGDGTYKEKIRLTVTDFNEPATQTYKYSDGSVSFKHDFTIQNRTLVSTCKFDLALALYQNGKFYKVVRDFGSSEINRQRIISPYGSMSRAGSWWVSEYGIGTYQVKVVSRETGTEEWLESADADLWYADMIIEEDQISYVLHRYEPEVAFSATVSAKDGLATYCPSNGVDFRGAKDIAAYKASVVDNNTVKLEKVNYVAAGEGVLIRSLKGGAAEEELPTIDVEKNEGNAFVGVLEDITLSETTGNYTNFVLSKVDGAVGFFKANNTRVAAGKAYLPVEGYAAGARGLGIVFDDETTTGISEIESKQTINDDAIYTLDGVRVKNPTKGLYIKNGKKVVIK